MQQRDTNAYTFGFHGNLCLLRFDSRTTQKNSHAQLLKKATICASTTAMCASVKRYSSSVKWSCSLMTGEIKIKLGNEKQI